MKVLAVVCLVVASMAAAAPAVAQDSRSAPLVKQLTAALEAAKLDSIATKDPAASDVYIGAFYIPGTQLLVISGKYASPPTLDYRILHKEYRDVYIDLNSTSPLDSRLIIEDTGADGLRAKRGDSVGFDSIEATGKRTMLNSDWKKQKLSEDAYMKVYSTSDERYAEMLTALLAQIKK
jgi:hypothetical protein